MYNRQWLRDSWIHYHELVNSEQASEAGVQMLSGYIFFNKTIRVSAYWWLIKVAEYIDLVYWCTWALGDLVIITACVNVIEWCGCEKS